MDPEKSASPTQASSDDDTGKTQAMPPYVPTPRPSAGSGEGETVQMSNTGEEATLASPFSLDKIEQVDHDQTVDFPYQAAGLEERTIASTGGSWPGSKNKLTRPIPEPMAQAMQEGAADGKLLQNRYRLVEVLGKGGFGTAYLAEDVRLERRCVVKQMLIPQTLSAKELELYQANFEREARLLAELNVPGHPSIPEVFDYFSDESASCLIMSYIKGQSLKAALKQMGQMLSWQETVGYIIEVASALRYMHTHGNKPVIHRDIKPDNILLGDDKRVWLIDFGLAKAKPVESTGDLIVTQAAGSPGYTPFEQWLGEAVPASDIYALGATLHHLVTGVSPAEAYKDGLNIEKLMTLHGQFPPVHKINKNLPEALGEVISRATHPDPAQRLTALQLQQQLIAIISHTQITPLFTFKNGKSATTVKELVKLCKAHRQEAEEYLYQGSFQFWFRLSNRNDLVEAAKQAVKQGKSREDGLERFLKLIMPNLAALRAWRVAGQTIKWILQYGRPVLPTALPTSTAMLTPVPTSTPTATPEGLALITIFNKSREDVILELEGEKLEIAANNSKAIEKQPGTYRYRMIFKATGKVGAEGEKTWGVQVYKWCLEHSGD